MSTRKNNSKKFGGWYNDLPIAIPQQRTAKKGGAVTEDITEITNLISAITNACTEKIQTTSTRLEQRNSTLEEELRIIKEDNERTKLQIEAIRQELSTKETDYNTLNDNVLRQLAAMQKTINEI